ncbi:MAG: histidinol dehydrogenase [Spirochaetaceae bacterium]|jgi:histidinol dehydrogenase|nr:histidinol dehydrogenase [Spirochaetaceae bacterium]
MKQIKYAEERLLVQSREIRQQVSLIIDAVRERGDKAVLEYAQQFDSSDRTKLRVSENEIADALKSVPKNELDAMTLALGNIRAFAEAQKASLTEITEYEPMPGIILGHRLVPVDSVCCYVPGGLYPLFSTAMMLITPAKCAGVRRIAACSPPMKGSSSVNPKTLAAMALAGADEIYALGGVQAIAAFAYGTEQIKNVDLIVGPGNAYVAEAKRQCYGQVGIDFIAGPSEILIIADESADPALVAGDLLAQCEHDKNAQGILLSLSEKLAMQVLAEIDRQLETLDTAAVASFSWKHYGEILLVENLDEAVNYANLRAPEHLEIQIQDCPELIAKLRNYGALFIGEYTAEVFGDYASGTNHTLPTLRASRYTGGLWVGTFLKTLCFQKASRSGAAKLAPIVSLLAKAEGLSAHSAAAERRALL